MTMDTPSDELALAKARVVLKSLRSAALKTPYGFDQEQAEEIWAGALVPFGIDTLTAAAGQWIMTNEEFPTVAEFLTLAKFQVRQADGRDAPVQAIGMCPECDDNRWVIIRKMAPFFDNRTGETRQVEDRHARPCSRCLPQRYQLYHQGHFDKEHCDQGGCKHCWHYMKPWNANTNSHNRFPIPS